MPLIEQNLILDKTVKSNGSFEIPTDKKNSGTPAEKYHHGTGGGVYDGRNPSFKFQK